MRLYFHTDRASGLHPGDIVEKHPYYDESLLAVFTPFIDRDFMQHLTAMARDGLSLHGAHHLIQIREDVHFGTFALELYYEYIRWKHYPGLPSRYQGFFAWLNYADAFAFARNAKSGRIYEIRCDTIAFTGDMNGLKLSLDPEEQARYARNYWEGKPLSMDVAYSPQWECILSLPVEVVREVLVNPVDMRPSW